MNFSFSTYFPNGLSINKLTSELAPYVFTINGDQITILSAVSDQTAITTIFANHVPDAVPFAYYYNFTYEVNDDLLSKLAGIDHISGKILYFSTLPNLTTINTILSTYTAPSFAQPIYFYQDVNTKYLTSTAGDKLVSLQPDEIVVSKNSGQFATVSDAINYINTLVDKAVIIKIFPGLYYENNPLILPANACLKGQGSAANTIIAGINSDVLLKTTHQNYITGVTLVGGTNCVYHDGSDSNAFSILRECLIQMPAAGVGISIQGGLGSLLVQNVSIFTSPTDASPKTGSAVIVNGGSLIATDFIIQAATGNGLVFSGGKGTLDTISIYYCTNGLVINNGSDIRGTLNAFFANVSGIVVAADTISSSPSSLKIEFIYFENTQTHLVSNATAKINIYSGNLNVCKLTLNVPIDVAGNFTLDTIKTTLGTTYMHGSLTMDCQPTVYTSSDKIAGDSQIYGFSCPNAITSIKYYNGAAFADVAFANAGTDYWLDLAYIPTLTTINSLNKYWLQITTSDISAVAIHPSATKMVGADVFYLGNSRKKKTDYLTGGSFIIPDNADTSSQYTITIRSATAGIVINGTVFTGTEGSVKSDWVNSFTYTAVNPTMIAITYYVFKQ